MRIPSSRMTKIGYAAAGLIAGGVLATTLGAQAATPTPSPSGSTNTTTADPHPGDNGADGVPEAQEHHGPGGPGGALSLSGTVTAVGSSTVTIKTSSGTTAYSVTSSSDIDKNGEAVLSNLAAGDAVTFSVSPTNAKQIDKLHAGNEAKDMPQGGPGGPAPSSTQQG
jgi:hypothetical protein